MTEDVTGALAKCVQALLTLGFDPDTIALATRHGTAAELAHFLMVNEHRDVAIMVLHAAGWDITGLDTNRDRDVEWRVESKAL